MLGNTLTSSPLFLAVSCTRWTVVVSEPNGRAPLSRMRNPGPSVDRKLSCAWLDVWKKLSLYSSETRAVGWNSRVAPRTVVTVGAKAPGSVRLGIPTYPGVPGKPGAPRTGIGRGAGIFVCDGAGGRGGVHGGRVGVGGVPGVIGGRPGCWIGYCWDSGNVGWFAGGARLGASCCLLWSLGCPGRGACC